LPKALFQLAECSVIPETHRETGCVGSKTKNIESGAGVDAFAIQTRNCVALSHRMQLVFYFARFFLIRRRLECRYKPFVHSIRSIDATGSTRVCPENGSGITNLEPIPAALFKHPVERNTIARSCRYGDRSIRALLLAIGGKRIKIEGNKTRARCLGTPYPLDRRMKISDCLIVAANKAYTAFCARE